MKILEAPTNDEIRRQAIESVSLDVFNKKGTRSEGVRLVTEEFLKLQFKYFCLFCEHARQINIQMLKELDEVGNKTSTKMIGGKTYQGTTGWSKNKSFQHKWVIPQQLRTFMCHIYKDFWSDENHKIRDKFMKQLLKGGKQVKGGGGGDYYALLEEVYTHYGKNIVRAVSQDDLEALGISK